MKFIAETLAERVLLKPFIEKQSKGGILIARSERTQAINTDRGEVFMIGPQAWYDLPQKPTIKVGDKVFYSHFGAKTIKVGEDYIIICNDKDILVGYEEVAEDEIEGHNDN
jgi:co-chaperonin GroES (HSP10)